MTFDSSLESFFEDTITIEPYSSQTQAQVRTYGAAVTYIALIQRGTKRVIARDGRELVSNVQVYIKDRVNVDQRSRVTLPTDFVPQQPPIIGVEPLKGLGMDHTAVYL